MVLKGNHILNLPFVYCVHKECLERHFDAEQVDTFYAGGANRKGRM